MPRTTPLNFLGSFSLGFFAGAKTADVLFLWSSFDRVP